MKEVRLMYQQVRFGAVRDGWTGTLALTGCDMDVIWDVGWCIEVRVCHTCIQLHYKLLIQDASDHAAPVVDFSVFEVRMST